MPEWGGFVIARKVRGEFEDVIGPYPRTAFPPTASISAGIERLRQGGFVSVVAVPFPLAGPDRSELASSFQICRPFKTHLIVDRERGFDPTKHHRGEIRRGLRRCRVEVVALADRLTAWRELYKELTRSHEISGVATFPDPYFPALAAMSQFVTFAAYVDDQIVAMAIWFEFDGVAVYHLAASSAIGYANGAGYALNAAAIDHFQNARAIDLGGSAGAIDDEQNGLFAFKSGFANGRVTAYLCGTVLDPERYRILSAGRDHAFFPAYRG